MPGHLSGETRLYPILGDPIIFVKSPQLLTAGFAKRQHNGICIPMEVAAEALDPVMGGLSATQNIDGLLITMPHKFTAFSHCATSSRTAALIGGVSVMRRNKDGSWHGDMLDGRAFVKAQVDRGAKPQGAQALLVGAGAAGGAIAIALLEAGVRKLAIYDTNLARRDEVVALATKAGLGLVVAAESSDPIGCDMVCNATPMGMAEHDPLPVPAERLTPSMFVGDVVAGHGVTQILKAAQAIGCKTAHGLDMVEAVQDVMLDFMLLASP
jgi:shikimate dehydrogenase